MIDKNKLNITDLSMINDIIDNKKHKYIFRNIRVDNNYTKKIYIRQYHLENNLSEIRLKIKKIHKRKKLKGIWIDKIFDINTKGMYYLYLLDNGVFCIIKIPNDIINKDDIKVLKIENINKAFNFIDENMEVVLNWNIDRISKRLNNSIEDSTINKLSFKVLVKNILKELIKLTYR